MTMLYPEYVAARKMQKEIGNKTKRVSLWKYNFIFLWLMVKSFAISKELRFIGNVRATGNVAR